jgi:hypothetical protein
MQQHVPIVEVKWVNPRFTHRIAFMEAKQVTM